MNDLIEELMKIQLHLKRMGGGEIVIGSTVISIKLAHGNGGDIDE